MPLLSAIACLFLAIGAILLFFGNRLAQFGFTLAAVAGAGLATTMAGQAAQLPQWQTWVAAAVASGTACLLSAFLFRVWMGFSTMIFMGLLVSAIVIIWQGPPLPPVHGANPVGQEAQALRQVWQDNQTALRHWWEAKPDGARHVISLAMTIGAILGLGLGLAMPPRAAALQCAAAGAGLILVGARELVEQHAPGWERWLPETPRAILLVFLVTAAVGFAAQGGGGDEKEEDGEAKKGKKAKD